MTTTPGAQYFTQDRETYYGTGPALDASLTQKIRLYGSWLYQVRARENRKFLADIGSGIKSQAGFLNTSINSPLSNFSHGPWMGGSELDLQRRR